MATLLSRSTCAKFSVFRKRWHFSRSNVFVSDFSVQIRNQRLKIDACARFQPDWTKDKGAQVLTWNDTENCLMASYLPHSDDVSKILRLLRDFLPEYSYVKFGGN